MTVSLTTRALLDLGTVSDLRHLSLAPALHFRMSLRRAATRLLLPPNLQESTRKSMTFLRLYDSIPADQPEKRFGALYRALQTDWRNLFAELRRDRPIIGDHRLTLVTRWSDVV